MGLWLVLNALTFVAFLISVFAFVTMWHSRPEHTNIENAGGTPRQLRALLSHKIPPHSGSAYARPTRL